MVYFLTIVSPQGFNSSIQVSGERSNIDNHIIIQCQCISITGKIFERVIFNQLFANLSDRNILSKHQYIWIARAPFNNNSLIEVTNSWVCNIDISNVNTVAFLDLKRAFDRVDHDILLSKLHLCGILGVTHKCFSPFFT